MSTPSRLSPLCWLLAPACALGLLVWMDAARVSRVKRVSDFHQAAPDPGSPTGNAGGRRWLIVPEHDNPTYQWIAETQGMLARGDWRVRSDDTENAPFGRPVHSATPYRAWLVAVAGTLRALNGLPLPACVERAALYANPLLHVVLLLLATLFVAWRFGGFAAALVSLGLAALYPLAGAFVPGVANDFSLELAATLAATLLAVAGAAARTHAPRWFFAAGVAAGMGLWVSAIGQVPVILGLALGGVLAAAANRVRAGQAPEPRSEALPWRAWALGGAVTCLAAYLAEYFPGHMDFELRANSPLYGLAWFGLGELLARFASRMAGARTRGSVGGWIAAGLAAGAVAAVPVALWRTGSRGFLADDLLSSRLTDLPDGVVAKSLRAWLRAGGSEGTLAAALLPLVLLVPAVWLLLRGRTGPGHRAAIAVALGPVAVALAFAGARIRWWNTLDVALLSLVAATAAALAAAPRPRWTYAVSGMVMATILACGIARILPRGSGGTGEFAFTRAEVEGLYERTLAHWIADHAGPGGATVLAPPYRTSSLCFYGGLRGLGTQNWENADGLDADVHIVTAMTQDEARTVMAQRGVTTLVLPSWDTDLDDFARLRLKDPANAFVSALHRTDGGIFSWLRPVPFELPPVAGFEDRSVLVLQVTDETDPATVRSRLVEYLVEMHRLADATGAAQGLQLYPTDLGAQVALAQLAAAKGDQDGFRKALGSILRGLSKGSDRSLAADRRVSLAVVLAIGGRRDPARAQAQRCFRDIDAEQLRFLTGESLYHLMLLGKRYGIAPADPALHALALTLLPEKLRAQF